LENLFPGRGLSGDVPVLFATNEEEAKIAGFAKSVKKDSRTVILWSMIASGVLKVVRVGALRALRLTRGDYEELAMRVIPEGKFVVIDCTTDVNQGLKYYKPGDVVDGRLDDHCCADCKFIGYLFEVKSMFRVKGVTNAGSR
jgi:hypothetical protein